MTDNEGNTSDHKVPTRPNRPSIALALGGGGARGLAHILVLEVFDEMGLTPKVIAGTSIGAIFGAAYASGLTASHIRAHTQEVLSQRLDLLRQLFAARNEPLQRALNVLQLRSALLNPQTLLDHLMPSRVARDFSELSIPLKLVAADFYTQREVVIQDGDVMQAIAASMALPAIFAPVMSEDRALLDGGLVNPLPFDVIANDADVVVAIDVSGTGQIAVEEEPPSALHTMISSLQILEASIVREKLRSRRPDVLIEMDVGGFHVLEFHKFKKVFEAAQPAKAQLRQKLERVLSSEALSAVELNTAAAEPGRLSQRINVISPVPRSDMQSTGPAAKSARPRLAERLIKSRPPR